MTRVYGSCIEPGGMELDEEWTTDSCPKCNVPDASHWFCERLEGGTINQYIGMKCTDCGYSEGDAPDDYSYVEPESMEELEEDRTRNPQLDALCQSPD